MLFTNGDSIAELHSRYSKLRTDFDRQQHHIGKLTRENEEYKGKIKDLHDRVKNLEKKTGVEREGYYYTLSWGNEDDTPKLFTMKQKIDAIMDHLGLAEQAKLGNKLVPAPKKSKKEKK